jgi:CheY-like chemotaxis protein
VTCSLWLQEQLDLRVRPRLMAADVFYSPGKGIYMTPVLYQTSTARSSGCQIGCREETYAELDREIPGAAASVSSGDTEFACQSVFLKSFGTVNLRRRPCAVCIDDDADFVSLLAGYLGDLGFSVIGARNVINGMRAITREVADVVILDYYLPNAFGTYVLRRLQQFDSTSKIPVIVVTGCDLRSRVDSARRTTIEQQLRRLGADAILRKPLNRDELTTVLSHCLRAGRPDGSRQRTE